MSKGGWTLYAHPVLLDQIEKLKARVVEEANPQGDAAKVLAWLVRAIFDEIPQDPTLSVYRQGKTLGSGKTHWFRDKYAGRFRLFFRYNSAAQVIVYGWVNDENSLRTYGSKTDAYQVFKDMLDKGCPPNDWDLLVTQSSTGSAVKRLTKVKR
jgi:toxin YhaV